MSSTIPTSECYADYIAHMRATMDALAAMAEKLGDAEGIHETQCLRDGFDTAAHDFEVMLRGDDEIDPDGAAYAVGDWRWSVAQDATIPPLAA